MTEQPRAPLSRERVLAVACEFADRDGLRRLSMRKLAAELGFEVMSLYNHVANKNDLLSAMAERAAAEIDLPAETEPWRAPVRDYAIATKAMFERHPWAVALWSSTMPGAVRFDHMEWLLDRLATAGADPHVTHMAFHALTNHVSGYMLQAQAMDLGTRDPDTTAREVAASLDPEHYPHTLHHIGQHVAGDVGASFEWVLDLLLDGIESAINRR